MYLVIIININIFIMKFVKQIDHEKPKKCSRLVFDGKILIIIYDNNNVYMCIVKCTRFNNQAK